MKSLFRAKYRGECGACEEPIEVDDVLTYDEDQTVIHADCAPTVKRQREDLRPVAVCPQCFTAKSVTGSCVCDEDGS